MPIWCWSTWHFLFSAKQNVLIVQFVDIVQLSLLILIQNQPARHRQVVLTRLGLSVVWILYSKIKLTTHLGAPAIIPIIPITTPYSLQCFLTKNNLILSSMLNGLETKTCGKMMVITSYFKGKLPSLKKYNYVWSIRNCTVERDSFKSRNQGVALLLTQL